MVKPKARKRSGRKRVKAGPNKGKFQKAQSKK